MGIFESGAGELMASWTRYQRPSSVGRAAGEHPSNDLQSLLQFGEAFGEGAELEAEAVVLELEPAGADAELRPAARDVVERRHFLGQQGRVAVGVARDQSGEPDSLGVLGQRRQQGVALEHFVLGGPEHGSW